MGRTQLAPQVDELVYLEIKNYFRMNEKLVNEIWLINMIFEIIKQKLKNINSGSSGHLVLNELPSF